MTQRRIPIDVVKVDEARLDETAYKQGFGAHDEMKRRVLERPAARSRYEEALAENPKSSDHTCRSPPSTVHDTSDSCQPHGHDAI